jgi:MoxR-like ATPase
VDGVSHPLSDLFTVVATQNPVEFEGTYRLPEAQLDRFLLKLQVGYPPADEEDRVLRLYHGRSGLGHPLDILARPRPDAAPPGSLEALPAEPALAFGGRTGWSREDVLRARREVAGVKASTEVCGYVGRIARQTRAHDQVLTGASPRAAVHLLQAAKTSALMAGRSFVAPDDVKRLCRPVLRHRITLQPDAYIEGFTTDDILTTVLERVEVPR